MSSKIHIGIAGWSYPDWAGVVYPDKRGRGGLSELSYIAQYIDAMEINSSFYRPPLATSAEKWLREVADRKSFLFTAKLHQRFTHDRTKPWSRAEAMTFRDGIAPLQQAGKFGALLMQFPWSFKPVEAERNWLAQLAEEFADFPCIVEVRHRDWSEPENIEFLRSHNLGFCNIDQPKLRSCLRPTNETTGPVAYYRFHGRNAQAWFDSEGNRDQRYDYLYSEHELAEWVPPIQATAEDKKVQQLFVIANNHYRGQAVVNALQIKAQLSGKRVPVPEPLLQAYPILDTIALETGQTKLKF